MSAEPGASVWVVYEMCTYEIMGIVGGFVFMDEGDARDHAEKLYKDDMKADPMSNTTFEVRRLELARGRLIDPADQRVREVIADAISRRIDGGGWRALELAEAVQNALGFGSSAT